MSSLVPITQNDKGIILIRRNCFGMCGRGGALFWYPDLMSIGGNQLPNWSDHPISLGCLIPRPLTVSITACWSDSQKWMRFLQQSYQMTGATRGISLSAKQWDWLTCKRCCCICCSCPGRSEIRRRGRTRRRFESRHRSTPGGRETRARAVNIINRPLSTKALDTWSHSRILSLDFDWWPVVQ